MPTATPTLSPASNWNQLSNKCETSACSIANGGCTITLSDDFAMGSYSGEIGFSGKAITIWGQEKVLDASGGGRFFIGEGAGSLLELHDAILQNGQPEGGGNDSCNWANDGECDVPANCSPGTDATDCAASYGVVSSILGKLTSKGGPLRTIL
jgi:hypothetical protein